MAKKQPFLTDVKTLRARARRHIEQGAVTESYRADRKTVIKLLNEAQQGGRRFSPHNAGLAASPARPAACAALPARSPG